MSLFGRRKIEIVEKKPANVSQIESILDGLYKIDKALGILGDKASNQEFQAQRTDVELLEQGKRLELLLQEDSDYFSLYRRLGNKLGVLVEALEANSNDEILSAYQALLEEDVLVRYAESHDSDVKTLVTQRGSDWEGLSELKVPAV